MEPENNLSVTLLAVEWSTSESFKRILGSVQVAETKNPSYTIKGLTTVSHARPLWYASSMQSADIARHEYAWGATHASERTHRQYLCIILVRAVYMTTTSPHELMMGETWNSYRLMWCLVIMASLLCFSKCRGCITLWKWAPSMWKDGGRLGARLRPALQLPVSILFWDGERVTISNS